MNRFFALEAKNSLIKIRVKRKETERKEKKRKEEKKRKMNPNKHALRAQAESRGDKVAACWYDQSYEVSS